MANLRIAELDFDNIKSNFKEFLKNYEDSDGNLLFTDFSFEGSNWSVLLDVLAYNTHYNAYLANMLMNEMFLDSAVKRTSAVSIAKHLGYIPRSARGAKATLHFHVEGVTGTPAIVTLERYTPFLTTIDDSTYTFVNLEPVTISPVGGEYLFYNVELTEGTPLQMRHVVVSPGPNEKYEIPNQNIDTSTIRVTVQNSSIDNTSSVYTLAEDALGVTATSKVYFLEENTSGLYQLHFGDDVLGKKLTAGNIVIIEYLVSNGSAANVDGNIDQIFTTASSLAGGIIDGINCVSNSTGGSDKETLTSIKYRAPKFSATYNRAVTESDYKALIESNYPYIESVAVWGGEENDPPMFGKVMIALKPYDGYTISQSVKDNVRDTILRNKKMIGITPEFVDPDYMYIGVNSRVTYNPNLTTFTSTDLQNIIIANIAEYFSENLQKFDNDFVYSQLVSRIDDVDNSIVGNITTVTLQRRIEPILNLTYNYINGNKIKFYNAVEPGSLASTIFIVSINGTLYQAVLRDTPDTNPASLTGTGTIKLYNYSTNAVLDASYGSINYATGELTIDSLNIYGYPSDITNIRINVRVQNSALNITATKRQVLLLDDTTLSTISNKTQGVVVNMATA